MRISIVNLKGGTGKTTTAVTLSAFFAREGSKVLLIDMDPLADATIYVGFEPARLDGSLSKVLFDGWGLDRIVLNTDTPNLDIAPATLDMSNSDLVLAAVKGREKILANAIRELEEEYEYIIIDTPSSMNMLLVNSLMATDYLIIPTVPAFLSIRGLKALTNILLTLKNNMRHDVTVLGILLTLVDSRAKVVQEVVDRLRGKFGVKVFDTIIKRSVGLIECPSFGQTIFQYDAESLGARCYRELGNEIKKKVLGEKPEERVTE